VGCTGVRIAGGTGSLLDPALAQPRTVLLGRRKLAGHGHTASYFRGDASIWEGFAADMIFLVLSRPQGNVREVWLSAPWDVKWAPGVR
jgi:hypothetical protein